MTSIRREIDPVFGEHQNISQNQLALADARGSA
jgi:hypothetical protein